MRTLGIAIGLGVLALVVLGVIANAQSDDVAEGKALYVDNCSGCHGLIASKSSLPGSTRLALAVPAGDTLTDGSFGRPGQREDGWRGPGRDLAVAPPYGPSLRGVYGRPAGSVAGFLYSQEFRQRLQGVIWNGDTLDIWIKDSQAWVPGSLMFYAQPDPEVRRQIIAYLATAR